MREELEEHRTLWRRKHDSCCDAHTSGRSLRRRTEERKGSDRIAKKGNAPTNERHHGELTKRGKNPELEKKPEHSFKAPLETKCEEDAGMGKKCKTLVDTHTHTNTTEKKNAQKKKSAVRCNRQLWVDKVMTNCPLT
jgi:hypothetical protein